MVAQNRVQGFSQISNGDNYIHSTDTLHILDIRCDVWIALAALCGIPTFLTTISFPSVRGSVRGTMTASQGDDPSMLPKNVCLRGFESPGRMDWHHRDPRAHHVPTRMVLCMVPCLPVGSNSLADQAGGTRSY